MTPHRTLFRRLLLVATFATFYPFTLAGVEASESQLREFVKRRGDQLVEGDKPFRFISVNIPNLQVIEDNFAPDAKTPWAWPTGFELNDALESVRRMGGRVARTYALGVHREGSDMGEHVYVLGPGEFNEEAFRTLDLAVEIAGRKGVRLIIPLVDNWQWHGGAAQYAAFRGKPPEAFWTDEQIIADFEQTVRHVLTRVNTRTGVPYRDDPAILGWETGNELDSPPEWTARIAALMKRLDPNHLVIDGNSLHGVHESSLADPNIDVVTTHHYPNTDADNDYVTPILAARERSRGRKPYFVGEFGFVPAGEIERVYDAVIQNGVCGALLWSLRFHHRDGGFYWHSEPAGEGVYKAYHWPGFPTGDAYQERRVMELTRAKAYAIRGIEPPQLGPPRPPRLLPINDVAAIAWQGSAGARHYAVERSESPVGPWTAVGQRIDDTTVQYRPLFNDNSAKIGQPYWYRIRACNGAGASAPSNLVGPVQADHRTLVDEGQDLSRLASTAGKATLSTGQDRRRREDMHRIALAAGSSATYRIDGPIDSWRVILFRSEPSAKLVASYSADGKKFVDAEFQANAAPHDDGEYGYLQQVELRSQAVPRATRWLRFDATGGPVELSRVEIRYTPQ